MLQNKHIFKKILPFLFLFVMSLGYVTVDLFQRITAPSQAAEGDIKIELQSTEAPLTTDKTWKWTASIFVDSYFKETINAVYSVDWCGNYGETGCNKKTYYPDYKVQIATSAIPIQAKSTVTRITHQSVNCGRVEISIKNGDKLLANKIYDTGVNCPDAGKKYMNLSTVGVGSDSNISASETIRKFLNIFSDSTEEDEKEDEEEYEKSQNPDPGNPGGGTSTPQNPVPTIDGSTFTGDLRYAFNVHNYILSNCGGRLTQYNYETCIKDDFYDLDILNHQDTKDKLIEHITSAGHGNVSCVTYTRALAAATGLGYSFNEKAKNQAGEYTGQRKGGFIWYEKGDAIPSAHDILIFNWFTAGHIVYVIDGNEHAFKSFDANMDFNGRIDINNYPTDHDKIEGFWRKS